ncbi:tetratricopeptide repeat protein [Candidatus Rickettsia barbariae]
MSRLQKYDLAVKMYNKTIQLNPDDFRAYMNKGIVLGILKKYNLALK